MTEVMHLTLRYVLPISQHQLIVIQFYVQIYLQSAVLHIINLEFVREKALRRQEAR
jgi:hypothetical protein